MLSIKKICVTILYFSITFKAYTQNEFKDTIVANNTYKIAYNDAIAGDYGSSLSKFIKAYSIYKHAKHSPRIIETSIWIAYCAYYVREYDTMITSLNYSLKHAHSTLITKPNYLSSTHYYLGLAYWSKLNYHKSQQHFQLSINFNTNKNSNEIAKAYAYLARASQRMGDFKQAIHYQNKSLSLKEKSKLSHDYLTIMKNLVKSYRLDKDYEMAHKTMVRLYSLTSQIKDIELRKRKEWNIKQSHVLLYSHMKDYDNAIKLGLDLMNFTKYYTPILYDQASNTYNIATAYMYKEDLQMADFYLHMTDSISKLTKKTSHRDWGKIFSAKAELLYKKKNYKQALLIAQKSICSFLTTYSDSNYYSNPSYNFTESEDALLIATHRKAKAATELALISKTTQDYQCAIDAFDGSFRLIDKMAKIHESRGAKINLTKRTWKIFEDAIHGMFKLYRAEKKQIYLEKAFEYMERSKSIQLKENLSNHNAQHSFNIPIELINQEREINSELIFLEKEYVNAVKNNQNADSLNTRILLKQKEVGQLLTTIKNKYPNYHQAKHQNTLLSLHNLQNQQLNSNNAIIEYFVGDSAIYSMFIREASIDFQSINVIDLNDRIKNFRQTITTPHQDHEIAYNHFTQEGYYLYQALLAKHLQKTQRINHIYFIPDGSLSYLPFELLPTQQVNSEIADFRDIPYLLKSFQISYAFSSTTLFHKRKQNQNGTNNFIAFAPSYTYYENQKQNTSNQSQLGLFRDQVVELIWNKKETEQIAAELNGLNLVGDHASEEVFKEKVKDYDIIHLAMHALIDNENPLQSKLVFTHNQDTLEDDFLHLYELYNLKLNAKLAVLSACETGFGNIERGEGVMSIGRGFAYAGCPSIVMSHWSVDDESTYQLMTLFYQELAKGFSKSKALQQAKLKYIENAGALRAFPIYWGSFIIVGDDSSIIQDSNSWLYGITSLLIFTLVSVLFIRKKRSS